MLVSTHDIRLVQELFPRTIVMDEGKIVADGLTMEILEDEALLNAYGLEKPWISIANTQHVFCMRLIIFLHNII